MARNSNAFGTIAFRTIAATGLAAGLAIQPAAAQQAQPTATFVVAFAAGGVADTIARLVAQRISERTGQKIVVDNRGGAGGQIAARVVVGAPADGTTFLVTTTALAVNETVAPKRGYSAKDLRPIAISASTPDIFAVHPSNPAKDIGEFVRNAKGKTISFGTAGVGTSPYISATYFFREIAKVNATHVPFTGGGPAVAALLGGHYDIYAGAMPSARAQVVDGKARGVGLTAAKRSPTIPDVPTFSEAGFKDFHSEVWIGFFAPAKTSDAVVTRLNQQINEIIKEPEIQKRLAASGFEPRIHDVAEANKIFHDDIAIWGKRANAIGFQIK